MKYFFDTEFIEGSQTKRLLSIPNYPKNTNEHSALFDAKWNKDLHSFLNTL